MLTILGLTDSFNELVIDRVLIKETISNKHEKYSTKCSELKIDLDLY